MLGFLGRPRLIIVNMTGKSDYRAIRETASLSMMAAPSALIPHKTPTIHTLHPTHDAKQA